MKSLALAALLIAAAPLCAVAAPAHPAPASGTTPSPFAPPVQRTLPNGLTVMVFPNHRLPIVQVQLLVPGGAADTPTDVAGVASMVASGLKQGTPSREAVDIAREAENMGATITSVVNRDYTSVGATFLSRDFDAGLELLADVVLRPSFPLDAVDRLRRETIGTVIQNLDNPVTAADDELWALALPGSPYGLPVSGTLETVPSLGQAQMRQFYRDRYRPDRSLIAVAGDVDPDRTIAAIGDAFESWSGRTSAAPAGSAPSPSPGMRIRIVDRPELTRCEIRVGLAGPARGSEDDLPITLANWVLGGSAASRLARATGGTAHSEFTALRSGGLLAVSAAARVDSTPAMTRSILSELKRFTEQPPTEDELTAARRTFVDVYPMAFDNLAGVAIQALAMSFYGLPADFSARYAERLGAITGATAGTAIRRWCDPSRAAVLVIGPAARLKSQFEALGAVEVLPAGGTIAGPPPTADEQKRGRELVQLAVVAHGGRAKLESIKSTTVTSDVQLGLGESALHGDMIQIRVEPERMVLMTKVQGQSNRQVLDGNRTWTEIADDSSSSHEGDSIAVARMRSTFNSDIPHLLVNALGANALVASRGRDRLGDKDVDRVDITVPGSSRRRFLLDAQTHRILALEEPGRSGVGFGARRTYEDYRQVDGLWWPFHEERTVDGVRVIAYDVKSVEINGSVPVAVFQRSPPVTPH